MSALKLFEIALIVMSAMCLILVGQLARAARRWRVVVFHDDPGCPGHTTGQPVEACLQGRPVRRNPP